MRLVINFPIIVDCDDVDSLPNANEADQKLDKTDVVIVKAGRLPATFQVPASAVSLVIE